MYEVGVEQRFIAYQLHVFRQGLGNQHPVERVLMILVNRQQTGALGVAEGDRQIEEAKGPHQVFINTVNKDFGVWESAQAVLDRDLPDRGGREEKLVGRM